MTKIYVTKTTRRTVDGETLVSIKTHESKPNKYDYIIFLEK